MCAKLQETFINQIEKMDPRPACLYSSPRTLDCAAQSLRRAQGSGLASITLVSESTRTPMKNR